MESFGCDPKTWQKCRLKFEYQQSLNTSSTLLRISVGTGVICLSVE